MKGLTEILSGSLSQGQDSKFSLWTPLAMPPILVSLECTHPRQHNDTSLVFIGYVVLELQLFFSAFMQA